MKPRYIEPDASAPEYAGARLKKCTLCGRRLPDTPDFFGVHAVKEYRYRRPECRSCRAAQKREYHARLKEADEIIDRGGA